MILDFVSIYQDLVAPSLWAEVDFPIAAAARLSPPAACRRTSAMASPYDPTSREAFPKKKSAPFKFLVPLIYAPVLPLIRIALRKNPVVRDRLFTAVLAGAFAHGFYLVTDIYDAESK
ncbi:hypothetical protein SDJN03_19142, partial [Cucurbita argyrosperma subsp. sororia]